MISRYTHHNTIWVDMESPTKEEILHIMEEFSVPDLVGEELVSSTLRSKVELYDNLVYVILHFPESRNKGRHSEQEIDFIIGKNFLITVRYDKIDPVHEFSKLFETASMVDREKVSSHGGYIFVQMMKELYKTSMIEMEELTKVVREIEDSIFIGKEEDLVRKISHTSRKLLDFKQALRFHRDILKSYESSSIRLFGSEYGYYANLVTSEFNKVNSILESNSDALSELQRTNDSLLSMKQNSVMKKFTVISFVTFPLMLITGIFGMNTGPNIIFINSSSHFFFVIGAMLLTSLVMFIFFRIHKWL